MITCRDFAEFVWAYIADELPPSQRIEFDAHLSECPHCVSYLDSYRKTVEMGKDAFADPDASVPADFPEELVKAIVAARAEGRE